MKKIEKNYNIKKNTLFNALKTISGIIFPLITFPYSSRTLGVNNIGKINYANSIISYFSMFAALGIFTYGVRECSKVKEDRNKLDDISSQIFSINVISTALAYIALFITLIVSRQLISYRSLIIILSFSILFTTLGADWINSAMGDFKYVSIRTILFQFFSIALMIIFVHKPADYIKYACISVVASGGANLLNIFHRKEYCDTKFTFKIEWKKHLRPILLLFSMLLSMTIYTSSDTTMIGLFEDDKQVGLYSTSVKIYNMVNTMVASVGNVALPQLSASFSKNNREDISKYSRFVLGFIITLGMPCLVGINIIAKPIIYTIAGDEYMDASASLHILTIALAFSFINGFYLNSIILPSGNEKIALLASSNAAGINFALNLFFIPKWGINGAASTTAIAELISYLITNRFVKIHINVKIESFWKLIKMPLLGSIGIIPIYLLFRCLTQNYYALTFLTIIFGAMEYFIVLGIGKNDLFLSFIKPIYLKFRK